MGRAGAALMAGMALAAIGGPARAGAWIAPEGGQEITTFTYGETEFGSVSESDYFREQPLGSRWALVLHPWVEYGADEFGETVRAEAFAGLKRALHRGSRMATAVQAGVAWRSDPPDGCDEGGGEVRALAGASWTHAFLNAEAAAQAFSGGCGRQRFEITGGFRPTQRWMALGQAFVEAGGAGDETIQLQASVVRFGADGRRGLQLGVRTRLEAEEASPLLVLGWWDRPGD